MKVLYVTASAKQERRGFFVDFPRQTRECKRGERHRFFKRKHRFISIRFIRLFKEVFLVFS